MTKECRRNLGAFYRLRRRRVLQAAGALDHGIAVLRRGHGGLIDPGGHHPGHVL